MFLSKAILVFASFSLILNATESLVLGADDKSAAPLTSPSGSPRPPFIPVIQEHDDADEVLNSIGPKTLDSVTVTADPNNSQEMEALTTLANKELSEGIAEGSKPVIFVDENPMSQMVAAASQKSLYERVAQYNFRVEGRQRLLRKNYYEYRQTVKKWPDLFKDKRNITFTVLKLGFNTGLPMRIAMVTTGAAFWTAFTPNVALGAISAAIQLANPIIPWNILKSDKEKYPVWYATEGAFLSVAYLIMHHLNAVAMAHGMPPVFDTQTIGEIWFKTALIDTSTQGVYDNTTATLKQLLDARVEERFKDVPNKEERPEYNKAMERNKLILNFGALASSVVSVALAEGLMVHWKPAYFGFGLYALGGILYTSLVYRWPQNKLLKDGILSKGEADQVSFSKALRMVTLEWPQNQLVTNGFATKEEANKLSFRQAAGKLIDPCRNELTALRLSQALAH